MQLSPCNQWLRDQAQNICNREAGADRDWSVFDHARQHGGLALPIAADVPQHQLLALDAGAREKQLLAVAAAGDLTQVAQLLRARVSPDCRDQFGSSPLIQAVYFR